MHMLFTAVISMYCTDLYPAEPEYYLPPGLICLPDRLMFFRIFVMLCFYDVLLIVIDKQ